ncbi:MAG: transposase [Opitutaceae bacterium]|nr:transposase [Opitutaceae bacterium]
MRAYFVTLCTHQRKPILAFPDTHALIDAAFRDVKGWWISQYLIMPDHIHFVCHPRGPYMDGSRDTVPKQLSQIITFVKARISSRWPRPAEQPIWQRDFWDTEIRSERHHQSRWNYIRGNPVRKGLVKEPEDWPYLGECAPYHSRGI